RNRLAIRLRQVVQEAGDGKRLSIAQFDIRLGTTRRQCRDAEAAQDDAVAEVERAHFGPHLDPDDVSGDGRPEGQADAELLVYHADVAGVTTDNGHRNFAAGEETGLFAVVGDQVRFGQALEEPTALERLQDAANPLVFLEEEQVQEVAEEDL